jgi:hypothetical protein
MTVASAAATVAATVAYDSVTAGDIPAEALFVIGWGDLRYRWSAADWARFPSSAIRQTVVGLPSSDGDWLDVEDTLATAADCPGFVARRRRDPFWRGGIYTFESDDGNGHGWPPVRAALAAAGLLEGTRFWIASELAELPPSVPAIPQAWLDEGVVLWQYAQSPGISPGHYDLSAIAPGYPPSIPPAPDSQGATMAEITYGTTKSAAGADLPTIFYPAAGDRAPVAIVQTLPPGPGGPPFGTWEWFAMKDPRVVLNGAETLPEVAPG